MSNPKSRLRKKLEAAGYIVFNVRTAGLYGHDGIFTFNNSHFTHDSSFRAAYKRGVEASSGVDPKIEWRVHVALWAARCAMHVEGDFVECGLNAGFVSSAIMHDLGRQRGEKIFYLIDTFRGPVMSQYSDEEVRLGQRKVAEDAIRVDHMSPTSTACARTMPNGRTPELCKEQSQRCWNKCRWSKSHSYIWT